MLTILWGGLNFTGFSQLYSYSFFGEISPSNETEVMNLAKRIPEVKEVKIRLKAEKKQGEIIFRFEEIKSDEPTNSFSLKELKNILLEYNLTPKQLAKLKD